MYFCMNASVVPGLPIRPIVWTSATPSGVSTSRTFWKNSGKNEVPRCSNMPIETTRSNGPSTSR